MPRDYAIRMPGSVEPQPTEVWEGGTPAGTAFALALSSEVGPRNRRFLKLGDLAFRSLPVERQKQYLHDYLTVETGDTHRAAEILRTIPHEEVVARSTFTAEESAVRMREAITVFEAHRSPE